MKMQTGGMSMRNKCFILTQKGFTLIELMSVLVIMGVIFSVAVKKFDFLTDNASITALKTGVRELNTQESLTWIQVKLTDTGWVEDLDVYNAVVGESLGAEYIWSPGPNIGGGTLHFKSQSVVLIRNESTGKIPGSWI
jgi:prepilin-type N-terminal cleavage/methylation domain-containing protein